MSEAGTDNSRKILTLLDVYMEFPVAELLGDDHYYMFKHGSLHGLFHLADEKVVNLLAITNSKMHNGQFLKFIEFLEKFTRDNNLKLVIGEIFNKRLDKWFEKRGYIKDQDNRVYRELA
jgi:hypothetical protein|nr:MAG TPA: hypothetical protein [Caudoviricetes sp.]